jgi:hypothetical protein
MLEHGIGGLANTASPEAYVGGWAAAGVSRHLYHLAPLCSVLVVKDPEPHQK